MNLEQLVAGIDRELRCIGLLLSPIPQALPGHPCLAPAARLPDLFSFPPGGRARRARGAGAWR